MEAVASAVEFAAPDDMLDGIHHGASDERYAGSDMSEEERTDPSVQLPNERSTRELPRTSTFPPISGRASLPPPPPARTMPPPLPGGRAATLPPSSLPKPTDPPVRLEVSSAQRQRLAQMEAQLENAHRALARQQQALEALHAQVEAGDARLGELTRGPLGDHRTEVLEQRVAELEERDAALDARATERPPPDVSERDARLAHIDERLRVLEEHEGEARIRMRLERATHRLDELERRIAAVESTQQTLVEAVAEAGERDATRAPRLSRLESLFEELADEVRAERDTLDLDSVRARLDDVETLVLSAGSGEASLKKMIEEQARAIASLRASTNADDDLTRIKGIGPKYARLLRESGTSSLAEIAAWTDEDVERVADALGIPAARVHKAGWVEAAQELLE